MADWDINPPEKSYTSFDSRTKTAFQKWCLCLIHSEIESGQQRAPTITTWKELEIFWFPNQKVFIYLENTLDVPIRW